MNNYIRQRNMTFVGAGNVVQAIIANLVDVYPVYLIKVCAPSATQRNAFSERYGV
ncbi:MAG: hypothetical protein ACTXOO_01660 [Sodalis sp. (in: enterobacteria)]